MRSGRRPTGSSCSQGRALRTAARARRVQQPRLGASPRAAAAGSPVRRRFARPIGAELALLLVVVGVTTALVAEPPAKAQAAARRGRSPARPRSVRIRTTSWSTPPGGPNEVHVYLLDSTGQPAKVDEVGVAATLPAADVGPLELSGARRARSRDLPARRFRSRSLDPPARHSQGGVRPVEHIHDPDRKGHLSVDTLPSPTTAARCARARERGGAHDPMPAKAPAGSITVSPSTSSTASTARQRARLRSG